jgi:hypothetical protein
MLTVFVYVWEEDAPHGEQVAWPLGGPEPVVTTRTASVPTTPGPDPRRRSSRPPAPDITLLVRSPNGRDERHDLKVIPAIFIRNRRRERGHTAAAPDRANRQGAGCDRGGG